MSMFVGESLKGDGNEIAHIDLLIGRKDGPVGVAFANALARQSEGHSNLLAVLTPNLAVKPSTVMVTKVTIKGSKQAVQMFGPAQEAVIVCQRVADLEVVKAGAHQEFDRLARCLHCGGEVSSVTLKFRRLVGSIGDKQRSADLMDVSLGAERLHHLIGQVQIGVAP